MPNFPHYYQTELAYYRELAREFARAYPEVAHMVAERGNDSAFERLIQGASLLTARLRFRVDDDFPEIVHALFDKMWPQYLRPIPAATLLQLQGRDNALRQTQRIEAGTNVLARPVNDVDGLPAECGFMTSSPVMLHPLHFVGVEVDRAHPVDLQLLLDVELTGGATLRNLSLSTLRIHLLGDDEASRWGLYTWLTENLRRLSVRDDDGNELMSLPASAVTAAGFRPEDALCPRRATPLPGAHLLGEYFAFVDKFLAIDIAGLDRIPARRAKSFRLVFHLGQPERDRVDVHVDSFAAGCTAAINVSEEHQVSLRIDERTTMVRLNAGEERAHRPTPIFSVARVGAYHDSGNWVEYQRFVADATRRLDEGRPCYQLTRRADSVEGVLTYMTLTDVEGRPYAPPTDVLYIWLRHTDDDLATRVEVGGIDVPSTSTPEFITFNNLVPVAPPDPVRVGEDRHWQLLAQFAIQPADLSSAEGLNELCEFARGARGGRPCPEVLEVASRVAARLHHRSMVEVREIEVTLDGASVEHEGERLLFARIVNQLFARPAGSRVFNRVTVRYADSGRALRFDPH